MKESVRIFRFTVVGTLNALITALVVWLMMHIHEQDYLLANVVAYIVAQIHNFIWSKYWIFPLDTDAKKTASGIRYCFCMCFRYGIYGSIPLSPPAGRGVPLQ